MAKLHPILKNGVGRFPKCSKVQLPRTPSLASFAAGLKPSPFRGGGGLRQARLEAHLEDDVN